MLVRVHSTTAGAHNPLKSEAGGRQGSALFRLSGVSVASPGGDWLAGHWLGIASDGRGFPCMCGFELVVPAALATMAALLCRYATLHLHAAAVLDYKRKSLVCLTNKQNLGRGSARYC